MAIIAAPGASDNSGFIQLVRSEGTACDERKGDCTRNKTTAGCSKRTHEYDSTPCAPISQALLATSAYLGGGGGVVVVPVPVGTPMTVPEELVTPMVTPAGAAVGSTARAPSLIATAWTKVSRMRS